jgi:hypothetical protein
MAPVTALIAQVMLIAGLAGTVSLGGAGLSPAAWAVGVTCGVITNAALARGLSYYRIDRLGPADWVTLARATLAVGVAALVADSFAEPSPVTLLVSLASVALALDAVDGWVARRTRVTGSDDLVPNSANTPTFEAPLAAPARACGPLGFRPRLTGPRPSHPAVLARLCGRATPRSLRPCLASTSDTSRCGRTYAIEHLVPAHLG